MEATTTTTAAGAPGADMRSKPLLSPTRSVDEGFESDPDRISTDSELTAQTPAFDILQRTDKNGVHHTQICLDSDKMEGQRPTAAGQAPNALDANKAKVHINQKSSFQKTKITASVDFAKRQFFVVLQTAKLTTQFPTVAIIGLCRAQSPESAAQVPLASECLCVYVFEKIKFCDFFSASRKVKEKQEKKQRLLH
jgi:hypothetical protein